MSVVYYARFICWARLHWSVLLPDCVRWTVLSLMECFCLGSHPKQKGSKSYITGSVTGSQKQAGHEYASLSTNSQKKKLLDVAESENKQVCHIQAAALTPSAYFSESLTVSLILFLRLELEFLPCFITKY